MDHHVATLKRVLIIVLLVKILCATDNSNVPGTIFREYRVFQGIRLSSTFYRIATNENIISEFHRSQFVLSLTN